MKVSVIIPVYNREAFVGTALRSLLRQRHDADLDVVVVDDGSTDQTAAIVSEFCKIGPSIRLVRQEKAGVARARNTGLHNVHPDAELVTFLDSDDVSIAGRFATELPHFREDPDLAMTYSMMTLTDGIDDASFVSLPEARTCTMRGISLTTAIFRRHAIAQVGWFDESLKQSEDLDFLLRFFELPLKYRLVDNVAILYRRHAGNITKATAEAKQYSLRALLRSAQRRRLSGFVTEIPKFFEVGALLDEQNASLR